MGEGTNDTKLCWEMMVAVPLSMYVGFLYSVMDSLARNIKESIFIRVNNPTLNKKNGKFNLPHIWDRVLLNTPGLTLKRHAQAVWQADANKPNIPSHLNQPSIPTHLGQPNCPMHIFTGCEYVHRTS